MEEKPAQRNYNISIIGVFFIALGAALILSKLHILEYRWDIIFWGAVGLYGFAAVIMAFVTRRRGVVFIGSVCFFLSIATVLHRLHLIENAPWDWFATLSLILGLSFLMLFFYDPRRIGVLIPVILFGAYGVLYYLWWYDMVDWFDMQHYVRTYWPVLLVLWGLSIILRRK